MYDEPAFVLAVLLWGAVLLAIAGVMERYWGK